MSRIIVGLTWDKSIAIMATFKQRLANHIKLTIYEIYRKETNLISEYIWELMDGGVDHEVSWKIIERAIIFSQVTGIK